MRQTTLDFGLSFGRHLVHYCPDASIQYVNPLLSRADKDVFVDITFVTYELLSLRNSFAWADVRFRLEEFFRISEKTVVFPQDDYSASSLLDDLVYKNGLIVYSPIHNDLEKIYKKSHRSNRFEPALTGYFESWGQEKPEPVSVGDYESRKIDLGGRVRNLPSYFGEQGRKKAQFATKLSTEAQARGFQVDFSDDDSQAMVGLTWRNFLKKMKFTIASRGGASLTDPTGAVSFWYRRLRLRSDISDFQAFELARSNRMAEGDFSAVGPRVIEAVENQVALLQLDEPCFDGFAPGEHYLAVSEDFSNLEEIFAHMRNKKEWVRLVNNSNQFLWSNRGLHYSGFIEGLIKTENINGKSGSPLQQKVYLGEPRMLDSLSHESHMALNSILKELNMKAGALKDSAAKFFDFQDVCDKDAVMAEISEIAEGLRSGEVSLVALQNSYLFGVPAVADVPPS